MRKPEQVLVIPYKRCDNGFLYAIFKREDLKVWQGIAGGVENDEDILTAAKREAFEEANIPIESDYIPLDSKSTIPVNSIFGDFFWGENVFNVIEYCFGVDANNLEIHLSDEHIDYRWVSYEEAIKLLKWDSNKNALWELNERLKRSRIV